MTGTDPAERCVVVKLGGSLMGAPGLDSLLDAIAAAERPAVLVPGGGLFADAVRDAQARLGFGDALAHRLAIRAMGNFAAVLADRDPRFVIAPTRPAIAAARHAGLTPIWDAAELGDGHPEIPESWDLTSDSLAAWLAAELGAAALLLLKSASPAEPATDAAALADAGIVDRAFPSFAARFPGPIRALRPADWPHIGLALASHDVGAAVAHGRLVARPA